MWDINGLQHTDSKMFSAERTFASHRPAEFEQERATRPSFARAVGELSKASHFLQQL
jgi:hypothetical protein